MSRPQSTSSQMSSLGRLAKAARMYHLALAARTRSSPHGEHLRQRGTTGVRHDTPLSLTSGSRSPSAPPASLLPAGTPWTRAAACGRPDRQLLDASSCPAASGPASYPADEGVRDAARRIAVAPGRGPGSRRPSTPCARAQPVRPRAYRAAGGGTATCMHERRADRRQRGDEQRSRRARREPPRCGGCGCIRVQQRPAALRTSRRRQQLRSDASLRRTAPSTPERLAWRAARTRSAKDGAAPSGRRRGRLSEHRHVR